MSEEITVEAVVEPLVKEVPAHAVAPAKSAKATKKVEEAVEDVKEEVTQKVITGPAKIKGARSSNIHPKGDNVLGSHAADRALVTNNVVKEKTKEEKQKIALWSSKNIRWSDVGSLTKGYNIVSKEAADKWLVKEGIREATPEEIATYYGK